MTGLTSKNIEELQALMAELGEPKFRARQVFEWLSRGVRPGEMTNLSKSLREKLAALPYGGATIYQKRVSAKDGTIKYLFALEDGNLVEGVLMRYKYTAILSVYPARSDAGWAAHSALPRSTAVCAILRRARF